MKQVVMYYLIPMILTHLKAMDVVIPASVKETLIAIKIKPVQTLLILKHILAEAHFSPHALMVIPATVILIVMWM